MCHKYYYSHSPLSHQCFHRGGTDRLSNVKETPELCFKSEQCVLLTPMLYCLHAQDHKYGIYLVGIGDNGKKIGR